MKQSRDCFIGQVNSLNLGFRPKTEASFLLNVREKSPSDPQIKSRKLRD
jgi:hypothetical protein